MLSLIPGLSQERAPRAAEVDGFFAADSMVRRLHRERVVLFSGVRGVDDAGLRPARRGRVQRHSIIFDDPRTRLLRTDERMSRIYFGASMRPRRPAASCRRCTAGCGGRSAGDYGPIAKGTPYDASDPELGLWVLATLADSALVYYERVFGSPSPRSASATGANTGRSGSCSGCPGLDAGDPWGLRGLRRGPPRRRQPLDLRRPPRPSRADDPRTALQRLAAGRRAARHRGGAADLESASSLRRSAASSGFSAGTRIQALLRSTLLQLRLGSRFWLDAVRAAPGRPGRRRRALRHSGWLAPRTSRDPIVLQRPDPPGPRGHGFARRLASSLSDPR